MCELDKETESWEYGERGLQRRGTQEILDRTEKPLVDNHGRYVWTVTYCQYGGKRFKATWREY